MTNYGEIRKLVACLVEVAVARLQRFFCFNYLLIKRSLMFPPGVCADFIVLCFHFYFVHGNLFCCSKFPLFKDQVQSVLEYKNLSLA